MRKGAPEGVRIGYLQSAVESSGHQSDGLSLAGLGEFKLPLVMDNQLMLVEFGVQALLRRFAYDSEARALLPLE
jgi:hypothetical protein